MTAGLEPSGEENTVILPHRIAVLVRVQFRHAQLRDTGLLNFPVEIPSGLEWSSSRRCSETTLPVGGFAFERCAPQLLPGVENDVFAVATALDFPSNSVGTFI